MKKRRFLSILLSSAILLSSNSIYATEMLIYEQDTFAHPTEAPLAEPGTEPVTSIEDETEYVTPEKRLTAL